MWQFSRQIHFQKERIILGTLKKITTLVAIVALLAMMIAPAFATDELIVNGDFEASSYKWNTYTDGFGTYDDWSIDSMGVYSGSVGVWTPVGGALGCIIVQNFTTPIPVEALINFTIWVRGGVGDGTFWAGLVFNTTGWIDNVIVLGAGGSPTWTELFEDDFSAWAGEKVSAITITAYGGDSAAEDVFFDLVSLEVTEGSGYEELDYTDPDVTGDLISKFTSFVVPVFVILLPAMLLMFLTRRVDKWLLIIGLVIGVGLGYWMMPAQVPLWLVFLVVIGLIGMAYQSVRGGNS